MSISDELERLKRLHDDGTLSADEFANAKATLLEGGATSHQPSSAELDQETRQWAMLLHFSQFAGYLLPLGGLLVPILIWQIKKSELPGIDEHGRIVTNWIISEIIYFVLAAISLIVLIGFVLLPIMFALSIIFPIIGGIKASNGEAWPYPMSVKFFG